jgi:lysophospholipase L1-like esterase
MKKLTVYGIFLLVVWATPSLATARVTPVTYTALGDSYSSGEGNDPFDSGCHRAKRADSAYPRILPSLVDYIAAPNFHACTGAVTADIWKRPQPGRRGQARQADYLSRDDRLVTLTIGGNDLHFSSILAECLFRFDCTRSSLAREVSAELNTIGSKLVDVYAHVRAGMSPAGYLVVGGYPHLFTLGPDAGCNPLISPRESAWIDRLVDQGNAKIAAAVRVARLSGGNVFYVGVVDDFAGHELCTDDPWLHGLKLSVHEGLNLVQGSYHPTRSGQRAYAEAIAEFLRRPGVRSALTASLTPRSAYSASSPGPGS